jgi:hypothetical protein
MSSVDRFYEWYRTEGSQKELELSKNKKYKRQYFTFVTEQAIHAYNGEENKYKRDRIFKEYINYPFHKLVENVYHTFKFTYFDVPYEDVQKEVVAFMTEKIGKFQEGKGKAFSYFTIIARNYLIIQNNSNYKKLKARATTDAIDMERDLDTEMNLSEHQENLKDFIDLWVAWYDANLNRHFTNERDIQIADTVLELFRLRANLESFNKKALYILIRERTGMKTQFITKVVNIMKAQFEEMYKEYLRTGLLTEI